MKSISIPIFPTVETPCGADYFTCPICYTGSDTFIDDNEDENEYSISWCRYCLDCNIIFDAGCVLSRRGCTDSVYNGLLINSFSNESNNRIHRMPVFNSYDENAIITARDEANSNLHMF